MNEVLSASTVVVGIDGSPAARSAAVWAADEAADRNLLLKLVFVIHPTGDPIDPPDPLAVASIALSGAREAVQAVAGVQVQTESLRANPLATLIELSRSAAMVAVGSVGLAHSCHPPGSTAAALAGSAGCPVAVIRNPQTGQRAGSIVAEIDASPNNRTVLGWAMAEAKLRRAPLRLVTSDGEVRRRLDDWVHHHPDAPVADVIGADDIAGYLAANAESIRLFVSGTRDRRSLGWAGGAGGCSVLTVGGAPR